MNTIVEVIEKVKAEVNRQKSYYYYINNSYNKKAVRVCNNLLSVLGYLEKEEKSKNSTDQEQPVKTNIVEDLKHYLSTTPKEQIKKDWESLKEWDKIGPSVSEFLRWNQPVCKGLEEEIKRFQKEIWDHDTTLSDVARHFAQWGAKHRGSSEIPKDLKETAENYAELLPQGRVGKKYSAIDFIAGAKYQAEQDQETIELAEDHAYLACNDKGVEKGFKFKDTIKCLVCGEDVTIDHVYSDLIKTEEI